MPLESASTAACPALAPSKPGSQILDGDSKSPRSAGKATSGAAAEWSFSYPEGIPLVRGSVTHSGRLPSNIERYMFAETRLTAHCLKDAA